MELNVFFLTEFDIFRQAFDLKGRVKKKRGNFAWHLPLRAGGISPAIGLFWPKNTGVSQSKRTALGPLSSPRAESARAVTGRRCPYSGEGEDFLTRRPSFFYDNGHNSETKSRKLIPWWKMNRLSNGYKWANGRWQNWGCTAKIGFLGQKRGFGPKNWVFWPKENIHFLVLTMFSHDQAKLCKQSSDHFQNDIGLLANLGCFFGKNGLMAIIMLFGKT